MHLARARAGAHSKITSGVVQSLATLLQHPAQHCIKKGFLVWTQTRAASEQSEEREVTLRKRSRDSRRAACVILPCSSAAGGSPARPNRILALCALCFVLKNTIVFPSLRSRTRP